MKLLVARKLQEGYLHKKLENKQNKDNYAQLVAQQSQDNRPLQMQVKEPESVNKSQQWTL